MSKLKYVMILSGLLWSFGSYAAGPITHVVLGEIWLQQEAPHYTQEQKMQFLLGTVFPDIRYLGVIERDKTHYKGITLKAVRQATSPFQQGMLFHSFVDEFREKWLRSHPMKEKIPELSNYHRAIFLKIIEDQILYPTLSSKNIQSFLVNIPHEEKTYGIDEKSLNEWHAGLALYFAASPAVLLVQYGLLDKDILNIKAAVIKQWATLLPQYTARADLQDHVNKMMEAFKKDIFTP